MNIEPRLSIENATVGVITALTKEFVAVQEALKCESEVIAPGRGPGRKFSLARVRSHYGRCHVVALSLLVDKGNNMAAWGAQSMLNHCPRVQHIIMTGIAGAVPNPENATDHVRLGDIVVCNRGGVIQYDMVVQTSNSSEPRNPPRPPSAELLEAIRALEAEELKGNRAWESTIENLMERLGNDWRRLGPNDDRLQDWHDQTVLTVHPPDDLRRSGWPRVFTGPIASANILLKDPKKRDRIRDQFGVKAVEMEGSGIADATWVGNVGYLVVRGTCDYCNPDKGDKWQKYAALIAAAYTRSVIEMIPPSSPSPLLPNWAQTSDLDHLEQSGFVSRLIRDIYDFLTAGFRRQKKVSEAVYAPVTLSKTRGTSLCTPAADVKPSLLITSKYPGEGITHEEPLSHDAMSVRALAHEVKVIDQQQNEPLILIGQDFVARIQQLTGQFEHEDSFSVAKELETWLADYESRIPNELASQLYTVLAEVAFTEESLKKAHEESFDFSRVKSFIEKAKNVLAN